MKTIQALKLAKLTENELDQRELSRLQGGNYCRYSNANKDANTGSGLCSSGSNGDPASFLKNTTGWGEYC